VNLTGRTAVVSGASRGIGKAIALSLAQQGANVALLYSGSEQAAQQAAGECAASGARAETFRCDVSDPEAAKETCKKVTELFGGADILVNNAGITRDCLLLRMDEEDFTRVLDVNLLGAYHMIRHLARPLMKSPHGRIVNISSVAGLTGNAGQVNYAASKAGLIGLTKSVAREFAGRGLTCNAIAPGYIDTDMTAALPDNVREAALSSVPLRRFGSPDDVARLALFLCSDAAAYITGEVIRCDGGLCM